MFLRIYTERAHTFENLIHQYAQLYSCIHIRSYILFRVTPIRTQKHLRSCTSHLVYIHGIRRLYSRSFTFFFPEIRSRTKRPEGVSVRPQHAADLHRWSTSIGNDAHACHDGRASGSQVSVYNIYTLFSLLSPALSNARELDRTCRINEASRS